MEWEEGTGEWEGEKKGKECEGRRREGQKTGKGEGGEEGREGERRRGSTVGRRN